MSVTELLPSHRPVPLPVRALPLAAAAVEHHLEGDRRFYVRAKRALDVAMAAIMLVVLVPLLLGIALAVRLSSPGPILFRQRRVGQDGREFTCLKFRTMVDRAEDQVGLLIDLNEHDGLLFKIRHDPRVTNVGRSLRRWSLDELPQLWQVVRGDMSLVGPRPPLPSEVARYSGDLHRRLLVKPGLTGLWQVNGRSNLPWVEAVRLDLYYVDHWSPMLDFMIVLRTARAVLRRDGAY